MTSTIHIVDLRKTYVVPERDAGLKAAVRSLVRRKSREVKAVDRVSFDVPQGEVVGFLGPNGAGKTTTLKMLSGLLYPTSGEISVSLGVGSRRGIWAEDCWRRSNAMQNRTKTVKTTGRIIFIIGRPSILSSRLYQRWRQSRREVPGLRRCPGSN